jgi:ATP-dependent exoDNAse (exonuclease V) beta subunit
VWDDEKAHIEAERLRLLYVAATRTREHLLIPCRQIQAARLAPRIPRRAVDYPKWQHSANPIERANAAPSPLHGA